MKNLRHLLPFRAMSFRRMPLHVLASLALLSPLAHAAPDEGQRFNCSGVQTEVLRGPTGKTKDGIP